MAFNTPSPFRGYDQVISLPGNLGRETATSYMNAIGVEEKSKD